MVTGHESIPRRTENRKWHVTPFEEGEIYINSKEEMEETVV